jgi:hypothetical protein
VAGDGEGRHVRREKPRGRSGRRRTGNERKGQARGQRIRVDKSKQDLVWLLGPSLHRMRQSVQGRIAMASRDWLTK